MQDIIRDMTRGVTAQEVAAMVATMAAGALVTWVLAPALALLIEAVA